MSKQPPPTNGTPQGEGKDTTFIHSPHTSMDDITSEQELRNAIDQYAMEMAMQCFGYFYTFGGRETQTLPTEDIMKAVEATFARSK